MVKCIFDKTTKLYAGGLRWTDPTFDSATQVLITLAEFPDKRTDRWDDATGIRAATAQELTDFDSAKVDAEVNQEIDGAKTLKALILWLAPLVGKTPAQARNEIVAIRKTL